jgi:hypothetical protein
VQSKVKNLILSDLPISISSDKKGKKKLALPNLFHLISGLATETTSVAYSSNHGQHGSTNALYQRNPNPTTYVTPGDRGTAYPLLNNNTFCDMDFCQ